jgi:hypothetical protein
MASQNKKKRSRKGRQGTTSSATKPRVAAAARPQTSAAKPGPKAAATKAPAPRVANARGEPLTRRQLREQREAERALNSRYASRRLGTYGDRPKSIFSPIPVAEVATFAGIVAVIIGVVSGGNIALLVGVGVLVLGVLESTAREHFSGYRSHAILLAAFPAVLVEIVIAVFLGVPSVRILVLAPAIPVFVPCFWVLGKVFRNARHQRVLKHPVI